MVRLKPPTAGIRILSIDGGGVRGIIPLEILSMLQGIAGSSCPVQDLFDLVYGTSIGQYSNYTRAYLLTIARRYLGSELVL